MTSTSSVRFRPHQAILIAAVIGFIGTLPLATASWYFLPLLGLPPLIAGWAVRAGTDADRDGMRLRALVGQRRLAWAEISVLGADSRGRVVALLRDGQRVPLPAVRSGDLHRLIAASGQPINSPQSPH